MKQILSDKDTKTISVKHISKDKIQVCRDADNNNYVLFCDYGAWRAFSFTETGGYDTILSSPSGIINDFAGIVEKYTTLGWEFYELQDTLDLIGWLAKGNLTFDWGIPSNPDRGQRNHITNGQGDGTDAGLVEKINTFLVNRGISKGI